MKKQQVNIHQESTQNSISSLITQKPKLFLTFVALIGLSLSFSAVISATLFSQSQIPSIVEVTYSDPRQAMIFWQTEEPTIGYIKYGTNKWHLNLQQNQNSDVPTTVHSVTLENLPLQPIYISFHNQNDNWPYLAMTKLISYEEYGE